MHLGSSEEPTKETESEEQPGKEPKSKELKPEETPQEQPAPEPAPEQTTPEQPTESQIQKPMPPEGQRLPPNERVNAAYKLVYGENAEIPIQHESIATDQDADWHIRSYMGGLFATPNDHPLTQKFNDLEELLEWFNETYPAAARVE
jgi:hypothetical protein